MRALLLQAFYTIRSERQLMEQLDYNLLFRWFVGLSMDAPVWDATVYSKNRDRLVAGEVAARFLQAVLQGERVRRLLSEEHFSVDGTLIEAWASMKRFRRKDGGEDDAAGAGRNAARDFRGERRSNATHASASDADARLFRKGDGQSSRLCFILVSAGDREHAEAQHRRQRVHHQRRIAPLPDAARQRLGQAKPAFGPAQQDQPAVRRDQPAAEIGGHLLAFDGWKIEQEQGIFGHGGRGAFVAWGEMRFAPTFYPIPTTYAMSATATSDRA